MREMLTNQQLLSVDIPSTNAPWEEISSFALTLDAEEVTRNDSMKKDFDEIWSDGKKLVHAKDESELENFSLTKLRAFLLFLQRSHWHLEDGGGTLADLAPLKEKARKVLHLISRKLRERKLE